MDDPIPPGEPAASSPQDDTAKAPRPEISKSGELGRKLADQEKMRKARRIADKEAVQLEAEKQVRKAEFEKELKHEKEADYRKEAKERTRAVEEDKRRREDAVKKVEAEREARDKKRAGQKEYMNQLHEAAEV